MDDTIIFCETNWKEIITMKRILRRFEAMSGLKINFHKNMVYGIGYDNLVNEFATKLNYMSHKLSLKYLGLPLGVNPKKLATWQPVMEKVKKKLSS